MSDFTPSDKLVIAVIAYLVLVTVMQFAMIFTHPELSSESFGKLVQFVIGAVIGYVGGRSE